MRARHAVRLLTCATRVTLAGLALVPGVIRSAVAQTDTTPRPHPHPRIRAQALVERALASHHEITGIDLAAFSEPSCSTIASSDAQELGEPCEAEELAPIRSGKPHVEEEKDGVDITVPLYSAAGELVGTISLEFKPGSGESTPQLVERARAVARELRTLIASRATLFDVVPSR